MRDEHVLSKRDGQMGARGPPEDDDEKVPLLVTNNCKDTIWPGIATQGGVGPGTGGFKLPPAVTQEMFVGPTWFGRVWARTNCTGSGDTASCSTGDCFSRLDCNGLTVSVASPWCGRCGN